jgi:hypothetical protein
MNRREFLKGLGVVVAAAAVAPIISLAVEEKSKLSLLAGDFDGVTWGPKVVESTENPLGRGFTRTVVQIDELAFYNPELPVIGNTVFTYQCPAGTHVTI